MSDVKHTPGPWTWEAWGDDPDDKSTLAAPPSSRPDGPSEMFPDLGQQIFSVEDPIENPADRELIAAAPDLLAELKLLRAFVAFEHFVDGRCPMCRVSRVPHHRIDHAPGCGLAARLAAADAVIAKAEGA